MNNIVLIGFMGCGKTTLGTWIADNYDYGFADTDLIIEKQQGRAISDIFAAEGEAYFRQLETDVIGMLGDAKLRQLAGLEDGRALVISVGGGLPVKEANRPLMKAAGKVVYLRTSVDELERRLANDTTRPLLAGGDVRERILSLMEKRADIYESVADVIIDTDGKSFVQIYEEIGD